MKLSELFGHVLHAERGPLSHEHHAALARFQEWLRWRESEPDPGVEIDVLPFESTPVRAPEIGLAAVGGRTTRRSSPVANIDRGTLNPPMNTAQMLLLTIAAKNLAGEVHAIAADQYAWASSDEAVVKLEPTNDPYSRMATTPGGIGAATITVTGPTGDTETLTIPVEALGPGEIGLGAGSPVSDLPPTP